MIPRNISSKLGRDYYMNFPCEEYEITRDIKRVVRDEKKEAVSMHGYQYTKAAKKTNMRL